MNNYAVLGLGMMGEAICFDILSHDPDSMVFGFELNHSRREYLEEKFLTYSARFSTSELNLDLFDSLENHELIDFIRDNEIKVVYGAIDYKFNEYLTRLCIKAGSSFLDLGGNPDIVESQYLHHSEAEVNKVTIVPDCGLAPGLANIIAAHGMDKFETLDSCTIRVGGLPQNPKTILKYQQVFSIRGLTNEYLEDAIVIEDGEIKTIPSLTQLEELEFKEPFGKLEAFQTAGGTSSLPRLFKGKIRELNYKTIRYPGHCQFFQFLKNYELLSSDKIQKFNISPREIVEHQLEKNLPKGEPDAVLVRIEITGTISGKQKKHRYELIDRLDLISGYTAMARTTAYPISIIGIMIAQNKIMDKGVVPGEVIVPELEFTQELLKRNITFEFIEL